MPNFLPRIKLAKSEDQEIQIICLNMSIKPWALQLPALECSFPSPGEASWTLIKAAKSRPKFAVLCGKLCCSNCVPWGFRLCTECDHVGVGPRHVTTMAIYDSHGKCNSVPLTSSAVWSPPCPWEVTSDQVWWRLMQGLGHNGTLDAPAVYKMWSTSQHSEHFSANRYFR